MREVMTKSMARNIFYGGSLFFILIFVGLTAHSHRYIHTISTDAAGLTDSVAAGKHIWKRKPASTATPSSARRLFRA